MGTESDVSLFQSVLRKIFTVVLLPATLVGIIVSCSAALVDVVVRRDPEVAMTQGLLEYVEEHSWWINPAICVPYWLGLALLVI